MIERYFKKKILIEAVRFTGLNHDEVLEFSSGSIGWDQSDKISIKTIEGTMTASIGDYVIKGIKGEFYPCKPDIFEESFVKEAGEVVKIDYITCIECKATCLSSGKMEKGLCYYCAHKGDTNYKSAWDECMETYMRLRVYNNHTNWVIDWLDKYADSLKRIPVKDK